MIMMMIAVGWCLRLKASCPVVRLAHGWHLAPGTSGHLTASWHLETGYCKVKLQTPADWTKTSRTGARLESGQVRWGTGRVGRELIRVYGGWAGRWQSKARQGESKDEMKSEMETKRKGKRKHKRKVNANAGTNQNGRRAGRRMASTTRHPPCCCFQDGPLGHAPVGQCIQADTTHMHYKHNTTQHTACTDVSGWVQGWVLFMFKVGSL